MYRYFYYDNGANLVWQAVTWTEGQKVEAVKDTGRQKRWCKATVRVVHLGPWHNRYVVQFRDSSCATLYGDEIREETKP